MKIYIVNTFLPELNKAKKIAKIILDKRLAACVNINDKIQSFFWWKNKISNENEVELSFKTRYSKIKTLIKHIEKHHPYECPSVLVHEIKKTNKKYMEWVLNETK